MSGSFESMLWSAFLFLLAVGVSDDDVVVIISFIIDVIAIIIVIIISIDFQALHQELKVPMSVLHVLYDMHEGNMEAIKKGLLDK